MLVGWFAPKPKHLYHLVLIVTKDFTGPLEKGVKKRR